MNAIVSQPTSVSSQPRFLACLVLTLLICLTPSSRLVSQDQSTETDGAAKKITTFKGLLASFDEGKLKYQKDESANTVLLQTSKGDFKGVLVIKWGFLFEHF